MKDLIETLKTKLTSLSTRDRAFAKNLIHSFDQYGSLTPRQKPWVQTLIDRAEGKDPEKVTVQLGEFTGVIALFKKAQEKLKYPKINLTCQGNGIVLSVAGSTSKAPGSINVAGEGHWGNRPWYGRVSPEGTWVPVKSLVDDKPMYDALSGLLCEFGKDPAGVAKKHGGLTGRCCFCNSNLTDARSTAAGFGPTCAKNFGLESQWKEAVKVLEAFGVDLDQVDHDAAIKAADQMADEDIKGAAIGTPVGFLGESVADDTTYQALVAQGYSSKEAKYALAYGMVPKQMDLCFMEDGNPAEVHLDGRGFCHACAEELKVVA
jgi:hypothetical protein